MARLMLKLLGDFAATDASGAVRDVTTRKGRGLLAFMALAPGHRAARERLAAVLWSDRGEVQARNSLRQTLMVLRKEAGEGIFASDDERLELRETASDVEEFTRLAASSDRDSLMRAVELWDGEFLSDAGIADPAFEDWLRGERTRLGEVLQGVICRLLPLENGAARVALAQRLVRLDPLRESSHLALMRAHAEAGDRAQALAAYGAVRDLLKSELGVAPGGEIEAYRAKLVTQEKQPSREPTGAAVKPSILILPFANLSGDPSRQYLSEGITEDLISLLGRSSEVEVVTRNAASLPDFPAEGEQAARALGADYVVKGAARASGTRLVVSCQLIEGNSGNVLWSERYDRQVEDIFEVLDGVAVRIVTALGSRLVSAGASLAGRKPTDSWSAYDYFLKGRELCNSGREWEAEAFFTKAVEIDSCFALAHAWRALGYLGQFWKEGAVQCLEEAHASAEKALQHDPNEPMAHYAAGTVCNYLRQFDRSEDHFHRAIALNPLDVNILGDYANLLLHKGRTAEALAMVEQLMARDPYPPTWLIFVRGTMLFFFGDYAAAVRALEGCRWNYRTHAYLAAAHAQLGHIEEASRNVEIMYAMNPAVTAEQIRVTSGTMDDSMLDPLFAGLRVGGFRG